MALASWIWHEAAAQQLLKATNSPVGRMLARVAAKAETASKARCPVDTGRLRGSINWRIVLEGGTLCAIIGTNVEYAIYVHEGTSRMPGRPFLVEGVTQALSSGVS
jgi:HK97 gp10 family phage protein